MNINNIRKDFPILDKIVNNNKLVYLDNAATTQKPNAVIEAISDYYRNFNSNIHRSVYTLGTESENIYHASKESVRQFINAKHVEEIIYTSGTTASLNNIARMLEEEINAGDEIITTVMEHHANLVPWQELAKRKNAKLIVIDIDEQGYLNIEQLKNSISEKTKVVTLTYASNVIGTINPVTEIAELLKDRNIYYIIDAAQAAPHLVLDVQKISCDFLVFSVHKMCGPTGIGVMYGKKKLLEKLSPVVFGGGMISIVNQESATWADIPNKFEAGTPLLAEAAGLKAAIDYLNNIGLANIEKYTKDLTAYLYSEMKKIDGIEIYGPENIEDRVSLVAFNLKGVHPHDLTSFLDEKGICIRAGHQCTQPLLERVETFSLARVSIYFYNTKEEIDIFIETLKATKEFFDNELF